MGKCNCSKPDILKPNLDGGYDWCGRCNGVVIKEQHPLTNEETFSKWLSTMCCRTCVLLKDDKCTHEKAEEHEAAKDWCREDDKERGNIGDVNDYFICDYFEDNL